MRAREIHRSGRVSLRRNTISSKLLKQTRLRQQLLEAGVTMLLPETVYLGMIYPQRPILMVFLGWTTFAATYYTSTSESGLLQLIR